MSIGKPGERAFFPLLHAVIILISLLFIVWLLSEEKGSRGRSSGSHWSVSKKVSGVGSLGTKANMGALKLGNFSHNASLKADNGGESFESDGLSHWNPPGFMWSSEASYRLCLKQSCCILRSRLLLEQVAAFLFFSLAQQKKRAKVPFYLAYVCFTAPY